MKNLALEAAATMWVASDNKEYMSIRYDIRTGQAKDVPAIFGKSLEDMAIKLAEYCRRRRYRDFAFKVLYGPDGMGQKGTMMRVMSTDEGYKTGWTEGNKSHVICV